MEKTTKGQLLAELKKRMLQDNSLPLKQSATNLVFGDGNPDAQVMFIGEGPGYWEDQKGIPFVGNAGALLNQMLVMIGLPREDVFITNVVHYRPPDNRDPESDELKAFEPYLDEMITTISPKIIVTLGRFSMAKFLPGVFISTVHGKPRVVTFKDRQMTLIPMYHPAAALRNGDVKNKFKNDFMVVKEVSEAPSDQKEDSAHESEQMSLI